MLRRRVPRPIFRVAHDRQLIAPAHSIVRNDWRDLVAPAADCQSEERGNRHFQFKYVKYTRNSQLRAGRRSSSELFFFAVADAASATPPTTCSSLPGDLYQFNFLYVWPRSGRVSVRACVYTSFDDARSTSLSERRRRAKLSGLALSSVSPLRNFYSNHESALSRIFSNITTENKTVTPSLTHLSAASDRRARRRPNFSTIKRNSRDTRTNSRSSRKLTIFRTGYPTELKKNSVQGIPC